ncbi:hypothetical protein KKA69_06355 [Patescibacteria group bacterium]|nr:hypothetical protein [Patescibacteria group bacterium]
MAENDKRQDGKKPDFSGLSREELSKLKDLLEEMRKITIEDFVAKQGQWEAKETPQSTKPLSGRELWPGRYYVEAVGSICFHRGGIFEHQTFRCFQPEMTEKEVRSLLKPLGFTPLNTGEEYRFIKSQAEETFTKEQTEELINYLKRVTMIQQLWKREAMKPIRGSKGSGAIVVESESECGIVMLSNAEGYDLNFKVYGYYDTRRARRRLTRDEFKKWADVNPELFQQVCSAFGYKYDRL